jgi:hypothetical protein
MDVLGKPGTGVCSNYSFDTVDATWDAIRTFKGGRRSSPSRSRA